MAFGRIIASVALTAIIAACGSTSTPEQSSSNSSTGELPAANLNATPSIAFTPANVKLALGGTVTFAFGSVGHNVFFDNDPTGAQARQCIPIHPTTVASTTLRNAQRERRSIAYRITASWPR